MNAIRFHARRYAAGYSRKKLILTINVFAQAILFCTGHESTALGVSIVNAMIWIWE